MDITDRARRAPLRITIVLAAALSGAGLLAACSASSMTSRSNAGAVGAPGGSAHRAPLAVPSAQFGASGKVIRGRTTSARLPRPTSIIYTASLTIRAADVAAAASKATNLIAAAGGYISNEQEISTPGRPNSGQVDLELKIPVAQYAATLSQLQTALGKKVFLSQQAQDVTQQVADVSSRVTSAQAAIRQLRTLLSRAGSVSDLLAVQNEINSQESSLESLLAQQRALAHETSYATVSLTLIGRHVRVVAHHKKSGGFGAGLRGGWHVLLAVVTGLLTAFGAVLPFLAPLALLSGIGYALWRWLARRRTPRASTPPAIG
jgi:hypothetical protein